MKRVIYKRNRTLSCKVDLTTVSYFSKVATKKNKTPSALLREIVLLYLNDIDTQKKVISFANKIELSSSFTNKNKLFQKQSN